MTCIAACTIATWRYRYSSLYRLVAGLSWTDMKRDVTYRPLLELLVEHSLKDTPYDRQSLSVVSSTNTNTSCTLRYQGKIVKKIPNTELTVSMASFCRFCQISVINTRSIAVEIVTTIWAPWLPQYHSFTRRTWLKSFSCYGNRRFTTPSLVAVFASAQAQVRG